MKAQNVQLGASELGFLPVILDPDVAESVVRTLATMMAYKLTTKRFDLVGLDDNNALTVTLNAPFNSTYITTRHTISTIPVLVLDNQPLRKSVVIHNSGPYWVHFALTEADLTNAIIPVIPGQQISILNPVNQLWMIAAGNASYIKVGETY